MDDPNVNHYRGEILEEVFFDNGIELLYTPIYSPDLNPAESVFSQLKKRIAF